MKNFFIGFSLSFFALIGIVGFPTGGAVLFKHLGYDKELGMIVGLMILLCIAVGLISMADDDSVSTPMKYKVHIGDKEFECNTISYRTELDSIIVTMDGIDSRVAIGTNIIICDK